MKSCPHCQRTFPDEYSFCLSDGTPLHAIPDMEEEPTVLRAAASNVERRSGRSILVYILAALLSLSLGITVAVLYFLWPRQPLLDTARNTNSSAASPTPTSIPSPSASAERVTRGPASSNSNTGPRDQVVEDNSLPHEPATPDPGPTRIVFRPGRVEETTSGQVNDRRSSLLYPRSGQQLIAQIRSAGDCVNFDTGDSSLRYTTNSGNNELIVLNSCDRPASFRLSVTIR